MRRGILRKGQPAGKSGWIFLRKHKKIDGEKKKKKGEVQKERGRKIPGICSFWVLPITLRRSRRKKIRIG